MKSEPSARVSVSVVCALLPKLTEGRDDIARIHGVLVLDEAEAIHELDFHDLTGAMGIEVILDIGLSS